MTDSVGGVGGTPGVPYAKDVEYWVRFLYGAWKSEVVPEDVIKRIRSAPDMFAARAIAMEFHNQMLDRKPGK